MLFNTFEFVLFFPIVTALYFILPHKFRAYLLLAASCFFYAFFKWEYILILVFTIVIDYYAGIWIGNTTGKKKKWALALSLIANLGVLAVFKYYYFILENFNAVIWKAGIHEHYDPFWNIALPIGLSFHTFQAMSYTIEVYRGNQKVERNFIIYALYVMFYPQLVAGPIERPQNVIWQFYEKHTFNFQKAKSGLRLMLWGMFKKMVIADNLSVIVDKIYGDVHTFQGAPLIIATVFYAIQIYADFSGYSDIALGSARVMGFDLMKNFDRPYIAKSISEFWRRWHISLSTWFRDYLYIPLGGNRAGNFRKYFNLFIVFMASGIWHGSSWNFAIWGALHGVYLIFGQLTEKLQNKILGNGIFGKSLHWFITICLVLFAWIFFRSVNFQDTKYIISHLFSSSSHSLAELVELITIKQLLILSLAILVLEIVQNIESKRNMGAWIESKPKWLEWTAYYFLLFMVIIFGYYEEVQFIYFQF
jgi:alginate O-acetyltransferase complex protein AlgI